MQGALKKVAAGAGCAAAAAVLWGTAGTAQSFVSPGGPDPFWVGALRLVFSALFFFPVLAKGFSSGQACSTVFAGSAPWYMLAAAASMVIYNFAFFAGVRLSGIAVGSAVTLGSAPIWAGLFALAAGRRFAWLWMAGVACAVAGGLMMAANSVAGINPGGLAFCLTAGFSYAAYAEATQRIVVGRAAGVLTGTIFVGAAVLSLPPAFALNPFPQMSGVDWIVVAYLGVVTTGVAYALFSQALKRISAASAVALTLLEPVTAFVAARFVAGEPAGWASLCGLVLILAGLAAILRSEARAE